MFDPNEIRDDHGEWSLEGATHALAHDLKKTPMGGKVNMPGGISVGAAQSHRLGHAGPNHRVFVVSSPGGGGHPEGHPGMGRQHDHFHSAHEAAQHALNLSARSSHPDSLGGSHSSPAADAVPKGALAPRMAGGAKTPRPIPGKIERHVDAIRGLRPGGTYTHPYTKFTATRKGSGRLGARGSFVVRDPAGRQVLEIMHGGIPSLSGDRTKVQAAKSAAMMLHTRGEHR